MADGIEVLRKQYRKMAAKEAGKSDKIPRTFEGQIPADDFLHLIATLPVQGAEDWAALQDADTGEEIFVLGVDGLGSVPLGG